MIILLLVWIHLVTKDRRQHTLVKNKGDIFDLWNLFGTRHSVSVISQHYFFSGLASFSVESTGGACGSSRLIPYWSEKLQKKVYFLQ